MNKSEEADDGQAREAVEAETELVRLEAVAPGDELVRRKAVDLALGALAKTFVTSEEVNDKFLEAKAAFVGLEIEYLSDVVGGLSAAGTPFSLRPFGMRRFDDGKVRRNLSEFLRLALFPASRIRAAMKQQPPPKNVPAAAPAEVARDGDAAQREAFRVMVETAEQHEQNSIFRATPERRVAPDVLDDDPPADGDRELAASRISSHLSNARREFSHLAEWRGARVSRRVAKAFGAALDRAEACLRRIQSPRIPATFIASDVHDGVVAAFRLVGAGPNEISGSGNAADILARIVTELAGLRVGLERDDDKRAGYARRMRNRAEKLANRSR